MVYTVGQLKKDLNNYQEGGDDGEEYFPASPPDYYELLYSEFSALSPDYRARVGPLRKILVI